MSSITLKRALLTLTFSTGLVISTHAQHEDVVRPAAWKDLAFGGRFMDRFEPMPLLGPRTGDTWGVDAVKPRDVLNGIEEAEWSYWGGNILEDKHGTYHLFVCRWREDHPKGHMAWHQSEVVRAVSKNRFGPYKVAEVIGPGHNPEAYPPVRGRFEDPVLWRTEVQYHMIVNDWYGRIAYHLRSKNGVHWKVDAGEAYLPGIAVSEDGKKDEWYKYERIKMFLDEHGRAVQANFAVIDYSKWEDKPKDIHSSKNISIPLTAGRLLTLLSDERITKDTNEIRVRIAAELGFDPHKHVNVYSLRFGAPEEVDFGRGSKLSRTEREGKDLIAIFSGKGNGFADHNFAGKLLGRTSDGKLLFGYCRLPWVDYNEPILSVRRPDVTREGDELVLTIEVSNHGQVASKPSEIQIEAADIPAVTAACPALEGYSKTTIDVRLPESFKSGKTYDLEITTGSHLQQSTVFVAMKVRLPR